MVARLLRDLATDRATSSPQEGVATLAPKLGPAERVIDWSQPADELVRRVRAFAPEPGATTRFRGEDLKVVRAAEAAPAEGRPGTIVRVDREGVVVATGTGTRRSCSRSRQQGGVGCRPPIGRAARAIWPASGSDHDDGALGRGRDGASRHRRGCVLDAGPARAPRAFAPGSARPGARDGARPGDAATHPRAGSSDRPAGVPVGARG